jgi:hypothetical protein
VLLLARFVPSARSRAIRATAPRLMINAFVSRGTSDEYLPRCLIAARRLDVRRCRSSSSMALGITSRGKAHTNSSHIQTLGKSPPDRDRRLNQSGRSTRVVLGPRSRPPVQERILELARVVFTARGKQYRCCVSSLRSTPLSCGRHATPKPTRRRAGLREKYAPERWTPCGLC